MINKNTKVIHQIVENVSPLDLEILFGFVPARDRATKTVKETLIELHPKGTRFPQSPVIKSKRQKK